MRKALLSILSIALLSANSYAQNGKKDIKPQVVAEAPDLFEIQLKTYHSALKYYDIQSGITALYTALAIKPERIDLRDSLALLYFAGQRFAQANAFAEELLKENPKRSDMLEIAAISKQSLGAVKESLTDYENLYKESKSVYHLYQIATLQYQLKRVGEATESLSQIIASPDADKQEVSITASNNQSQNVPLKAAAYNVRGIIAMDLNNETVAKQNFEAALQIFPDFVLAKGNLNAIINKQAKPSEATKESVAPKAPVKPVGK